MTREEYIQKMEILINIIKNNPSFPLPYHGGDIPMTIVCMTREEAKTAVEATGPGAKSDGVSTIVFTPQLLKGVANIHIWKEEVCKRVVTGKKHIEELVIPAHDEEIVEWECGSLLKEK